MRSRRNTLAVVAAVLGVGTLSLWAAGLKLEQLPQKAQDTIKKLAGNNRIGGIEAEKEGGVQVFEAGWMVDGREQEVEVTADGILLEMEESVDVKDVPEAVKTAAQKELAGAPSIHYEKHTYVIYEVEGKVNGKGKEVVISPTGKVHKDDDDGDDDDGDDDGGDDDDDDDAPAAPAAK